MKKWLKRVMAEPERQTTFDRALINNIKYILPTLKKEGEDYTIELYDKPSFFIYHRSISEDNQLTKALNKAFGSDEIIHLYGIGDVIIKSIEYIKDIGPIKVNKYTFRLHSF